MQFYVDKVKITKLLHYTISVNTLHLFVILTLLSRQFDDTFLFSVVHDINTSATEIIEDLNKINNWAFQWKMNFNPDPSKQAQEVLLSRKLQKVSHPKSFFNNSDVSQNKFSNTFWGGIRFEINIS